jgi:hypothetical protein
MGQKIVDYDPHTGITETYQKDEMSGKISIHKTQDITGLTNINTEERNNASSGWKEEFHKVASIPLTIIEMWREELKRAGYPDPNPLAKCNEKWFIAKINSSDFLKLRTKTGVI